MKPKKNFSGMLVNIHPQKWVSISIVLLLTVFAGKAQTWTLQQCIDSAQIHNKSLAIGSNNIAIGEQKQKEAQANLIPKVNLAGDYKYFTDLPYQLMPMSAFGGPEGQFKETQFGVPHNMSASIQVTLPIYNPQLYGGLKATKIAVEISQLQYKKTEEQVFFDISNLYYNVQILQHQLAFIDSNISNTKRLLGNLQLLKEQMMVKGTDVSKVELQNEQLSTQRETVSNTIEQVLNALKFTIGVSTDEIIQVESLAQSDQLKEYNSNPTLDIQLTQMQNKFLTSELSTLRTSRLPSLSLYGSYGQTGFGYDEKPNDFLKFFPASFVGLQLSYPIFNGTVTHRKINQKKLELQNSELQINLVTEQNAMLIENAKRQRNLAEKTISNSLLQITHANTIYEQTLLQQKEGTANLSDVLLADTALREAQQTHIRSIVDLLKSELELKKLTGNIPSQK